MYQVSFHVDRRNRSCRAEVFARSTSDTHLLIYRRDPDGKHILRIFLYHGNCICRTVSCAVSAVYIVSIDYAEVKVNHGVTYLD